MTTLDTTQPPTGATLPVERWPATQAYLTEAFAQWHIWNKNRDRDISFVKMMHFLDAPQVLACLAGKMNQQVCNGGFVQWVDNRYIDEATIRELIGYIEHVHRSEAASSGPDAASVYQVLRMVRNVRDRAYDNSAWNDRLQTERQMERFAEALRQLTPAYFDHGDGFMDAVERYLVATYPRPEAAPAPVPTDALSHRDALREVLDALGALTNPSELHGWIGDEDLQRRILEAAERPE